MKRELWRLSNGMCHLCRCELDPTTRGDLPTAEVAHIVALGDNGPRAVPSVPVERRNAVENLMFLCPSCHSRVDKNSGDGYSIELLVSLKERHEAWTRSLRAAGSSWNIRYQHVDFANVPRLAMLPGGDEVLQAAKDVGLDPGTAFRQQGPKAGAFVRRVRPVFENWGERAIDLDPDAPVEVEPGMVVSFDSPVRARNMKRARNMAKISDHIKHDPHLRFSYGERTVMIRFDPIWLTTTTSLVTLGSAEREAVTYAGLGTVVAVTKDGIQVSAMVFGQPENEVTAFNVFLAAPGKGFGGNLDMRRMVDDRSAREARVHARQVERKRIDAVLYFDELHQEITGLEPIQQATFSAVVKAVPEYRRKLSLGWASLYIYPFTSAGYSRFDLASELVGADGDQWSTISIPRLSDLLKEREVVYALLRGVESRYLDDIDEILTEEFRPYCGAFQHLDGVPLHQRLHECPPGFRMAGGDLRALYSARDLYEEEWDRSAIERWRECGLFSSVEWEEDEARSRADEEQAQAHLRALIDGD